MITFKHNEGIGQVWIFANNNIKVFVDYNDDLQNLLQKEINKGIPVLIYFKNNGAQGKYKTYREVTDNLGIVTILKLFKNKFPHYGIDIQKRYTLLKWNGKYSSEAKFIVKDNYLEKQSLFTPGRCEDLFWFDADLSKDESVASWGDFGEESFDDLEEIAF